MSTDNQQTCEHHALGIGTAILIKYRRDRKDDLFMCSFRGTYHFYCRKHFDLGEEIWFYDGKPRKKIRRKTRAEELEEQLRDFFSLPQ
mgnify:CR=1 FL=1